MACTPGILVRVPASAAKDDILYDRQPCAIRRSCSTGDALCHRSGMVRRSRSETFLLRCALKPLPGGPSPPEPKITHRGSVGIFPYEHGFQSEAKMVVLEDGGDVEGPHLPLHDLGKRKRANWVERLLELRRQWKDRRLIKEEAGEGAANEEDLEPCAVVYDSEDEEDKWAGDDQGREGKVTGLDREAFSALLAAVPLGEIKLFSQLAFLCNAAYVIPQLKAEDLRNYYDLRWVTSSLEKKSKAAAAKEDLETDSSIATVPELAQEHAQRDRAAAAYEIAASAASYVHSRTSWETLSVTGRSRAGFCHPVDGGDFRRARDRDGGDATVHESEVAVHVATSTMTAVIAAEEAARLEAARELRSLQSCPCEWLVCDEPDTCTRCFVIQGSDSLASWQANLFFEPTKFERTGALVHRGIYEAAKGIYEQFLPEILSHLSWHGERARLRFTGHSLGGSLSLMVHLMLLARGAVPPSALLPVVTFGSPFVFCGGHRVLDELGLDEGQVRCVMMHRDIVPRAFSCSYPDYIAQLLKRLNRSFRSHPCLNKDKLLYSPLGKLYIVQPDEKSSPPHPLLPPGCALYALDGGGATKAKVAGAVRAFLNSPHPLEMLSHPAAYGSEGTILRDHESGNYLKAVNEVLRQHTKWVVKRSRAQRLQQHWWPLLKVTVRDHPWRSTQDVPSPLRRVETTS
ncbi:hypothetical protein Taro_014085 [Colocasia esculenta]|uniref:Fungal lipase-type domain-containing protein n=1 Tax=Colocasia esculenta TaxID=4460 RepID=A0A843U867_COLES|nr:hypothetical protein [Colocasia esculenta]